MSKERDFREGLRSAYIPHAPVDTVIEGPSLTSQEFAEECDINEIMKRYETTGGFGLPAAVREPMYLDLTNVPSFHEAHNLLIVANDAFMSLPASVRKRFGNDPAAFIEFAEDPKNIEQMREWKLAPPAKVEDPPQRVEVVNPTPAEKPPQDAPKGA